MIRSVYPCFSTSFWRIILCFILIPPFNIAQAQVELEGEENVPVRITGNPQPSFFGGAQLPPYRQMATFLNNAFNEPAEGMALVQDSSVCSNGIPNSNDFQPYLSAVYGYNDDVLDEITFHQINIAGSRTPFSRKQFTYEGGRLKQYLYSRWEQAGSMWQLISRVRYLYDDQERPDAVVTETWNGTDWELSARTLYQYNSQNRLSGLINAEWANDMWVETERVLAEYNENRLPTVVTYQEKSNDVWVSSARETSFYDDDFEFIQEGFLLEVADESTGELTNAIREQYEYDLRGFYSSRTQQTWDSDTKMWSNALKDLFTYSPTGVWKRWDQEIWDDKWKPALIREFKFNNGIQVDEEQAWLSDLNDWINTRRRLVQFDEHGNLVRERNRELWNPVSSDWVNGPNARQCRHYWSEQATTSVKGLQLNTMVCNMMNPYLPGSGINCVSGDPAEQYQLDLFNQAGKLIYHQSFRDHETFSIDGNMPMGMYHMIISDQNKVQYRRKVVIQD